MRKVSRPKKILRESILIAVNVVLQKVNSDRKVAQDEEFAEYLESLAAIQPLLVSRKDFCGTKWRIVRALLLLSKTLDTPVPQMKRALQQHFARIFPETAEVFGVAKAVVVPKTLLRSNKKAPRKSAKKTKSVITYRKTRSLIIPFGARRLSEFYESFEWRKLRYSVIQKYGRVCMACGRSDGIIHVDHIQPIRRFWELRLNADNLQVLCEECNHGKGSWDETDWRPLAAE